MRHAGHIRVGVTYNLKRRPGDAPQDAGPPDADAEYDDFDTILAVKGALEAGGCEVELIEATQELLPRLAEHRPDIVFNIAEGLAGRGREAHVPAILSFLQIPFTGSDETTMCVALDKSLTKKLVAAYNIRTPEYMVFRDAARPESGALSYPVIIKPNAEGSGKGISDVSVVSDAAAFQKILKEKIDLYGQDMLAEEFIKGREFTVGILGNEDDMRIFPPMEVIFKDGENDVYSYEIKRNFKRYIEYECPPDICDSLRKEIVDTAGLIFRIFKCRDYARIDFRVSQEGRLYFIEINPIPGLAPGYSDYPMLAGYCGVEYTRLIQSMLNCALTRYGLPAIS